MVFVENKIELYVVSPPRNQNATGNIPSLDGNEPLKYHTSRGNDIDPAIYMENCATATQKLHNCNDTPYIQSRKVHHSGHEYVQADMSTKHSPKHSIERGILEITATSDNKSNKRKPTRPTPSMNENLQPVKSRAFINSKYTKQPTSKSKNEHENKRQPLVNKKYKTKNYIHDYQPWKERPVQIKKAPS